MAWRVLVVDDHQWYRRLVMRLLRTADFTVVGEAGTGNDAVRYAATTLPDVVLLDVMLPDGDGFEVARRLASLPRPPLVVLISSRLLEDYGHLVDASPVCGFISKDQLTMERLDSLLRRNGLPAEG